MDIAQGLVEEWDLEHCVVTMGAQGALCASKGGTSLYDPGYVVDFIDTCGAGDAFSAGFVHCLLHGRSVADALRFGNVLGSIVASQHGPSQPITTAAIEHFVSAPPRRVPAPDFEFYLCKEALN
jgi:fructokinase